MLTNIPNYEGYQITEDGRVFSLKRNRFLKPAIDKYGYLKYTLSPNGNPKTVTAHRLVAATYISNPLNLPCINHINENKLDNRIENLEWCTVKYNDNYGSRNRKMANSKCKKPVIQILADGTEILYKGVKDAFNKTGIAHSQIAIHAKDGLPTRDGSTWRYANV